MTIIDDRNDLQKNTHVWAVVATDKFMSGWGGAKGGKSIVALNIRFFDPATCFLDGIGK